MKTLIQNYSFSASGKTVTFTDYASISIENILLITDVTAKVILYSFAESQKDGSVSGNTITLTCDTSSLSDSDKLQIYYDDPDATQTVSAGTYDSGQNLKVTLGTVISGEDPDNDALRTESITKEYTGSAASLNADLVPSTEVMAAGFNRFSLQISGTWSGTITVSCSNDNQNFSNATTFNNASTTVAGATSITANGTYFGYINYKYIRVRMTAYSSGTATANLIVSSGAGGQQTMGVIAAQSGIWTFHPAISGSSSVASTAASTSSSTILASNTSRRAAFIANAADQTMYIKFGNDASVTSYTKKLGAGEDWALPTPPIYSGILTAVWDGSPSGQAITTELT